MVRIVKCVKCWRRAVLTEEFLKRVYGSNVPEEIPYACEKHNDGGVCYDFT